MDPRTEKDMVKGPMSWKYWIDIDCYSRFHYRYWYQKRKSGIVPSLFLKFKESQHNVKVPVAFTSCGKEPFKNPYFQECNAQAQKEGMLVT